MIRQKFFRALQKLFAACGLQLSRVPKRDPRYMKASFNEQLSLPEGANEALNSSSARLQELKQRYAACNDPVCDRSMWGEGYLQEEVELSAFRGDNAYVWQFRNMGGLARQKYYLFLRDIASRDSHNLLTRLEEDGLFGCWTFEYEAWPLVSRDLLDSINELYFLQEHLGLLDSKDWSVLDIGAGYGRLAHRLTTAVPDLQHYYCCDVVPESTFLCEYYLKFRGLGDKATAVPVDELDSTLAGKSIQLAINIHSFSEASLQSIEAWLKRISDLEIPHLLIVPNDGDQLISSESDGQRLDFMPSLEKFGFQLQVSRPVFDDSMMREYMNVSDHFFLFSRVDS